MLVMNGPCSWTKQSANFGLFNGGKSLFASFELVYTSATSRTLVFWSLLLKTGLEASAATTLRAGGVPKQVEKSGNWVIVSMLDESFCALVPTHVPPDVVQPCGRFERFTS